jgi:hypothetical protein
MGGTTGAAHVAFDPDPMGAGDRASPSRACRPAGSGNPNLDMLSQDFLKSAPVAADGRS